MTFPLALRLALRDLRGGLRQFTILLACLFLGVTAIAVIGSVRQAIETGLDQQASELLGGDAVVELTYRFADDQERAWLESNAETISEVVDFRSMARTIGDGETDRGLTQVKAVDSAYPLLGQVALSPDMALQDALSGTEALPGAVMETALMDQMQLQIGQSFQLGVQEFVLTAEILSEPDETGIGFRLGPRTIVLKQDLAQSGLLEPGTLFETEYRMILSPDTNVADLADDAKARFENAGLRWRDTRDGEPRIEQFVDRLGRFLVLIGLTGLAVGGIGVASAVRTYLTRKTDVIAILRSVGAPSRLVFHTYLIQIAILSCIGVGLGVATGAVLPLVLQPILQSNLPVPADFRIYTAPLAEAALYGMLTAFLFSLWPLTRTLDMRAAALFRATSELRQGLPKPIYIAISAALLVGLVGSAALFSGNAPLTLWTAASVAGALALLALAGLFSHWIATRLRAFRLKPVWLWAIAAISARRQETIATIVSIGLGLSVLSAIGQIDGNLRSAIERDLPDVAPSFFFIDIQQTQLPDILDQFDTNDSVSRVDTAPMLRGVITQINGQPAQNVAGDHWVIRGDRGVTYAALPDDRTVITEGTWWPESYSGPPQISFSAEEAAEIGLQIGDSMVVNILGRDISATVTSFREVDFSNAGIGFVMVMNPSALQGAPHSHIATVYASQDAEAGILRDMSRQYPNITAIRIRDAVENAANILAGIAGAIRWGAMIALVTGVLVLIGTAAEGESRPAGFEAATLKTLGASRVQILTSFALRSAILGIFAGIFALVAGSLGALCRDAICYGGWVRCDLAICPDRHSSGHFYSTADQFGLCNTRFDGAACQSASICGIVSLNLWSGLGTWGPTVAIAGQLDD